MEPAPGGKVIIPNPQIPKIFGILNIVFASGLLLYGLCMNVYLLALPTLNRAVDQIAKKASADQEATRKAELAKIDEDAKAAKTDDEKAEVDARRKEIESRPKAAMPPMMDMKKMGLTEPRFQAFAWTDFGTGLIMNILMMASGIAMVMRKSWGITLALWVAGVKIVRLVAVYGYMALAIVPDLSMNMAKAVGEMMAQQSQALGKPPAPVMSVESLARIYTIMYTSIAVGMILIGIIYPVVSLYFLSRPSARAACAPGNAAVGADETW